MVHVSCLRNRPGQFHLRLPSPRQPGVLLLQRPTRATPDRLRGPEVQFLGTILHGQRAHGTDVIDVLLDRQILRGTQISTSPRYVDLRGSFTASEDYLAMTVSFSTADKFLSATWGLDNVVITPA